MRSGDYNPSPLVDLEAIGEGVKEKGGGDKNWFSILNIRFTGLKVCAVDIKEYVILPLWWILGP